MSPSENNRRHTFRIELPLMRTPNPSRMYRRGCPQSGHGLSAWLAGAATATLRAEALDAFLHAWEKKHAALTARELNKAERELALRISKKSHC